MSFPIAVTALVCSCVLRASAASPPDQPVPPPSIRPAHGPHCEYVSRLVYKPAGEYCGFNDAGAPVHGLFDCGLVNNGSSCVEQCTFVRCHEP